MRRLVAYLRGGRPIPKSAMIALFGLSLTYMQVSDPREQFSGYWPGVDVSAAARTLLVGVGVAAVSAWVAQRWPVRLRMQASVRAGWQISVRDLVRLYLVVITMFAMDYALLVAYRFSSHGAGTPKYSVVVDCMVWLLFCVTMGWAIGSILRAAAAIFTAAATTLLLSVGSVMANDGHIGFPLLAGRQLPSLPSYAVDLSPTPIVTIVGIITTLLVAALIVAATIPRRVSWKTTGAALASAVVIPIAASIATGGSSWLEPRVAATEPVCVGSELQVCSWNEDTQRLAALGPALPKLTDAMRNTGYPIPARLSVSGAMPDAAAKICPFRTMKDGVVNILGRVSAESASCIGSDRPKQCAGDVEIRGEYLALTQIYMGWLGNFPLGADRLISRHADGSPTEEYLAAEHVLSWPPDKQFFYMSQAYRAVSECDATSAPALLDNIGYR